MGSVKTAVERPVKEAYILKACTAYLRASSYLFWRVPLGGVMRNGGAHLSANPMKGFPDLAGILKSRPGVMWAAELKTATGRLSAEQRSWANLLRSFGVAYFIARSVEELVNSLATFEAAQYPFAALEPALTITRERAAAGAT